MKKIMICLLGLLTLSIACKKDPLDVTPDGRTSVADIFQNSLQTEAYLNTGYGYIPSYFYKYQFWSYLEGCTDNAADSDVGNEGSNIAQQWISGTLSPSYNPLDQKGQGNGNNHYETFWTGIYFANTFLANIDAANVTPENRARFTAEAKLQRAFYYLELIKQFGALPIIDKPLPATFDYASLTRPTFQQCADFIVKDCDDAIATAELPWRIATEAERGRFSKAVAFAIKSEVLLYNASPLWNGNTNVKQKWQAAATAAQTGIITLKANGYDLYPIYEEYFYSQADLTTTPRDKETIYEVKGDNNGTFTIINAFPTEAGQAKAGSNPSQELVDAYEMKATGLPPITGYTDADHFQPIVNAASGYDPNNPYLGRDPRFYASVWYNGSVRQLSPTKTYTNLIFKGGADGIAPSRAFTHTGYYLRKFYNPAIPSKSASAARWKKFRLAELYMNLAEAENEANGPTNIAYDAVNAVRFRAGMPGMTPGLLQGDFQTRVRNERRVEFFMEEHRFWDVRRWKMLDKTDKLTTGMDIVKTGNNLQYNRVNADRRSAWQDKFLIFPLPIKDASIIPDFTKNQNPGW